MYKKIKKKISNDEAIRKMKMGGSKGIFKADMTELESRRAAQASSSSQIPVETATAQRCLLRRSGDLGIHYRKERELKDNGTAKRAPRICFFYVRVLSKLLFSLMTPENAKGS